MTTCGEPFSSVSVLKGSHVDVLFPPSHDHTPLTLSSTPPLPFQRVVTSKGRDSGRTERERGNLMCAATLVAQRFKLTERERADRRRRTMSQNISHLLDPKVSHAHRRCLVHQVNLVNKFQLPPFRRFSRNRSMRELWRNGSEETAPQTLHVCFSTTHPNIMEMCMDSHVYIH